MVNLPQNKTQANEIQDILTVPPTSTLGFRVRDHWAEATSFTMAISFSFVMRELYVIMWDKVIIVCPLFNLQLRVCPLICTLPYLYGSCGLFYMAL